MSKHVLFVDDEPNVLLGLQRSFHCMRHEWEMAFVNSGAAALEALAKHAFDVVVTDMRMPGIDGAALLEQMVIHYPNVARIVLSGHADAQTLLRAATRAHQYLSKPCDIRLLRAKISQALTMQELLSQPRLKELVSSLKSLPTLPSRHLELVTELESVDPTAERVTEIVSCDLGMTAKVLQLANSPFFGPQRRVATAREGIQALGVETIKALVISERMFSEFEYFGANRYDVVALGRHSISVSRCARIVATS